MADSIVNTATFTTSNMKPAAAGGENIDAVWGRNVADNTGYLYHNNNNRVIANINQNAFLFRLASGDFNVPFYGTYLFKKYNDLTTLSGTWAMTRAETASPFTGTTHVLVNGGTALRVTMDNTGTSGNFSYDVSGLTNLSYYNIHVLLDMDLNGVSADNYSQFRFNCHVLG
jgi:hypothetical protein